MAIRIVRLGSPRQPGEGIRLGTVRRPPRGVPRAKFASLNYYDVWLPELSPSAPLVTFVKDQGGGWPMFVKRFRAEMKQPAAGHVLDVLAALSHHVNFSLGCYCEDEARCHRSVLRDLLAERGAKLAGG
jgi:uncharacterized protein YeaO (DUF488 family)